MLNPNILAVIVPEILVFIRTDGHVQFDSASDRDLKYIYFMESETLLSTCYIVCDKSNTVRLTGINIYILKTQLM